ncbi:unnamed protein product, partial [Cladocopium goreaui]
MDDMDGDDDEVKDDETRWAEGREMALDFMARNFFNPQHFLLVADISSAVANGNGNGSSHVIAAASRVLDGYGVKVSKDEQDALTRMSQDEQVENLMSKIPQGDSQFQDFFVKLQHLVLSSDRVRASLEQADLTQLEDALVDAENAGIGNAVFRMSAVQAGSELRAIGENFRDWGKDNALKTGKLTRCQEEALGARKKLAAAQAKLQNGRHKNLEKSSKWVLRFAETSSRGSVRVLFRSWSVYARFSSAERRVHCDYQERLVSADALLDSFRLRSKGALRRLLERQAVERCRQLALECFWLWQEILVQRKLDEECEQKLLDFQCKMKDMKQAQIENAKLILRRACAENDLALIRCCFQAFHETWQEAAQEQHIAVQVDLSQEKMKEFMKRKSTIALRLLKEMCYATAAGFQQEVFSSWVTLVQQSHGEGQLQGLLQQQQQRIEAVRQRSRNNNHLLVQGLEKQYHSDMQLEIFSHWRTFAGVESKVLGHKVKVDAKRQQLQGVQSLFRSFAAQLERQLRESHSQK